MSGNLLVNGLTTRGYPYTPGLQIPVGNEKDEWPAWDVFLSEWSLRFVNEFNSRIQKERKTNGRPWQQKKRRKMAASELNQKNTNGNPRIVRYTKVTLVFPWNLSVTQIDTRSDLITLWATLMHHFWFLIWKMIAQSMHSYETCHEMASLDHIFDFMGWIQCIAVHLNEEFKACILLKKLPSHRTD